MSVDERLAVMSTEHMACRGDGHDWNRRTGVEYVHVEDWPDGSVKIGERRIYCRDYDFCGVMVYTVWHFDRPGGAPRQVGPVHHRYDRAKGYLAAPGTSNGERLTRTATRSALVDREGAQAWGAPPPKRPKRTPAKKAPAPAQRRRRS